MTYLMRVLAVIALLAAGAARAEEGAIVRIGGDYKVEKIEKANERSFAIVFQSQKPTGRFDVLRLESDHVHVAVKVGQVVRMSAEILADRGKEADVSQVVLFLPNATGRVPVWLLSNKVPQGELRGSKYLEMHSPLNDYVVM